MSVSIVVPELGESILDATIAHWLKKEGDPVAAGEPLVELETDKVNLEVPALKSGVLAQITRKEQEDVKVGDEIGVIEESAQPGTSKEPASSKSEGLTRSASAEPAPRENPEGLKAKVAELAPIEGAKPPEGKNGGDAQGETPEKGKDEEPALSASEEPVQSKSEAPGLTPVAQRLVREMDLDVSRVSGSGPGGRITKTDVENYLQKQAASRPAAPLEEARALPGLPPVPPAQPARREERIKMSRRRRTIAQRLVEVQQTAAMLTTFNEVDVTRMMDLRSRRNESFQARYGVKLGITSFFVKAAIGALKAFPLLNAEVQGDEMLVKYYYDIGVAVGSPEGLVVPVLRDADRMSFAALEAAIADFVSRTNAGSLTLEDLRGGTFSITNGGVFGSLMSTPILTPPQVGILGLHKIEKRPVVLEDQVVVRPMMYTALSYDHRIVDGREAVQFLVRVKELIEDPEALLLEG